MDKNPYLPRTAKIVDIEDEVGGPRAIKTFRTQFVVNNSFSFLSGQCAMVSVFGKGEAMFSISSTPLVKDYLQFSVMKMGKVTSALHDLQVGDIVGIRGPYGNNFPLDSWRGKNLVFIAGGIGLAPLWSVIQTVLRKRDEYGRLTLFYGARTSDDLVFKREIEELKSQMTVLLSVDAAEPGWTEFIGFVPNNVLDKKPSPDNAIAMTCGPPIMIKFTINNLRELGFRDEHVYTTVENKMKCGVGKCGRCNIGVHYVCKNGPVYSWAELNRLPPEF
jgi:NAD(P)H-flavin reductase